jgi:hypothetical protein
MKIVHAKPLTNFQLELAFEDGVRGIVDLSHLAGRGVFQAWNTPTVFDSVRITEFGAVEWPGEIDLCPDSLYLKLTGKLPAEMRGPSDELRKTDVHSHA